MCSMEYRLADTNMMVINRRKDLDQESGNEGSHKAFLPTHARSSMWSFFFRR
jgi:hypothetical protein